MTPDEYQRAALRTQADQRKVLERLVSLGPSAMQLDNAIRGMCNDVGEVADLVKDYIEYGKPLDRAHLLEELGDVCWRVAQACQAAGFTMGEALEANIRKLSVRYPEKYTNELAANRDRAAERKAVAVSGCDGVNFLHDKQGPIPGSEGKFYVDPALAPKVVQDGHGFGHAEYVVPPAPLQVGDRCKTIREVGPLNENRYGVGRMIPPGMLGLVVERMGGGFAVETEYGQLYIKAEDLIPVREAK